MVLSMTQSGGDHDTMFMMMAIAEAEKGRQSTAPNPWVGCVIVKDNQILAQGHHKCKGGLHAERNALANLTGSAEGATAYVTLEPCCHHGATPPCTDALIESKIARVVVAIGSDPDEKVNGNGVQILRNKGIIVDVGVCEAAARDSLAPYLHQRRTGSPYVVAKVGMSMNGKIAYPDGSSQWITSVKSREQSMRIRSESQAIIVGINTVLVDNPKLTVRDCGQFRGIVPFYRVVIDPQGKLSFPENQHLNLVKDGQGPVLVFTSQIPSSESEGGQIEWFEFSGLESVLKNLAERGVIQILVEGGSRTLEKFFEKKLIQQLTCFVAPKLVGVSGLGFYSSEFPKGMTDGDKWELLNVKRVDGGEGDVRLDYRLVQ